MKDISSLPAAAIADELNSSLEGMPCAVVTAPPGAGKSTLLPLTLLQGFPHGGKILLLEPRRLAARKVAERMAWLLDENVGNTVGYRTRFETKVSKNTRIEVLTEGILTRMMTEDPALDGVGTIIFDEFHERSLVSDTALALVREARSLLRKDLRLVIMSATIDAEPLCHALGAPHIICEGKMFPVEIRRSGGDADAGNVCEIVARTILKAFREDEGDILAFLPGEGEIRRVEEMLGDRLAPARVYPLYGMLPAAEQNAAIAPSLPGERKVVLSTPVAETSITIEGVRIVVDSGLCRRPVYDPQNALSRLETVRISLDMAAQRSGRAGRVAPGVCYRLWSVATESRMAPTRRPEILDADLSEMVLSVAAWGEANPERLSWITPPPKSALLAAKQLLISLGAINEDGKTSSRGKGLTRCPCHPRIAGMLLSADSPEKKALAADLAALLEERDPMPELQESGIDARLNAFRRARRSGKWARFERISLQYRMLMETKEDNGLADPYEIGALAAAAYPERVAKAWRGRPGQFQFAKGDIAALPVEDALSSAEWIVATSLNAREGGVGKIFLAAPLAPIDLEPHVRERDVLLWDREKSAVVARRERKIGVISVSSRPISDIPVEDVCRIICEAAHKDGLSMFSFTDEVAELQRRIAAVAAWHPEMGLPELDTTSLLARVEEWLPLYIGRATSAADLRRIDMGAVLTGLLNYEQRAALDRLAPTHIVVPSGSRIRVEYRYGAEAPVLRVRLQECFGLMDTPRVDGGRRPVLMELLSPGFKPVQLTSDLKNFWKETYYEVRKELRRRYPRHAWPDNPLEATPVKGVNRQ